MRLYKDPRAILGVLLIVFAIGYYIGHSRGPAEKAESKDVRSTSVLQEDISKNKRTTKTVVVKAPDGTERTESEVTDELTDITRRDMDVIRSHDETRVTAKDDSGLTVSALAAITPDHGVDNPLYGVSVTKRLGVLSAGVFGLSDTPFGLSDTPFGFSNASFGVSLGVNF